MTRAGGFIGLLSQLSFRQRFTLVASSAYIILGLIIVVRSVVGAVLPLAVLGIVLIALGVVRIRDFVRWRSMTRAG